MRRSLALFFAALPKDHDFQAFVEQTFDTIDSANAWELAHCRFPASEQTITITQLPDYGNLAKLAERSLGHTLSPLAILAASNVPIAAKDFTQTQKALRHYLIARQLN